jgi:uncharacterized RDD family membrane protein YckC
MPLDVTAVSLVYAGFWQRFAALLIDGLIVGVATVLCGVLLMVLAVSTQSGVGAMLGLLLLFYVAAFIISAAYFTLLESGELGATYGKRLLGLRVVNIAGERISTGRALGRWFAHWITNCTFYIGYLMQPFTANKQALHDMVSSTVVIEAKHTRRGAGALVAIMAGLLLAILLIGIVAALVIPSYQRDQSNARVVMQFEQQNHSHNA